MNLKGMLFDFDGTIGDTLPICVQAFHLSLEPILGRPLTDEAILATFGPSEEGTVQTLLEACGLEAKRDGKFTETYYQGFNGYLHYYEELHKTISPRPFDGMDEILRTLKERGLILGLVTGKGAESCEISLRQYGLTGLFDQIETGKPDGLHKPSGIRRILDRFNLRPEETLYVGDTPTDVSAARLVGIETLGVGWSSIIDREKLLRESPRAFFDRVADFRDYLFKLLP